MVASPAVVSTQGLGEVGAELIVDLVHSLVDVVSDSLQGVEAVDLIDGGDNGVVHRAVVLEDGLVVDDAEALIAVCNGGNLAVVLDCQGLVGQMIVEGRILQIVGVVIPGLGIGCRADVEDGRCIIALCHLGLEGRVVLSVCCGQDIDLDAGLIRVGLCQILPGLIGLRLEV